VSDRFQDRIVVVTGASRGLGRAIACAFAAEGAHVAVGYLRAAEEATRTLDLMRGSGEPFRFDVTRPDEVQAAFAALLRRRGRVDVLVNNAGVAFDSPAPLLDPEGWRRVLAVNLDGAFHCTQAVLPGMLHARRGAIVNVASVSALRANPGQASYAASKGGLLALSRTLAAELAPRGIRVNAVVPGLIDAGMVHHLDHRLLERLRERIPVGRLGLAEEVARAVLFLSSDEASYVVGCELPVDGGLGL